MAVPIWKDKEVVLGSGASYDFEIRLGSSSGAAIYAGTAYKRPGATNTVVRINDVCADWLAAGLPALAPVGFTALDLAAKFSVCAYISGSWTEKELVEFYNDWSYDRLFDVSADPLSCPIMAELDPRQTILVSVINAASVTFTLTYLDGTTSTVVVSIAHSADFNDDFNDDFSDLGTGSTSGAAVLDLSQFTDLAQVSANGVTWDVRDNTCARYAVYYTNAYGGWDSLILDGIARTSDALTRHTAMREYNNADSDRRGWMDFAVEVERNWELNTGILTDDQSELMHHLLNSTNVFLYDFFLGEITPVVLTDVGAQRKTYKGNGRQVIQYTFNAKEAQTQVRR